MMLTSIWLDQDYAVSLSKPWVDKLDLEAVLLAAIHKVTSTVQKTLLYLKASGDGIQDV